MRDLSFDFRNEYIYFDGERFKYTTPLGLKYVQYRTDLRFNNIDSISEKHNLNLVEDRLFWGFTDRGTEFFEVYTLEDYWDREIFEFVNHYPDDEISEQVMIDELALLKDTIDSIDDSKEIERCRFIFRCIEANLKYLDIIGEVVDYMGLGYSDAADKAWDIVYEEYTRSDVLFNSIDWYKVYKAVNEADTLITRNMLTKSEFEKMKRQEKKAIRENIDASDSLNELRKYLCRRNIVKPKRKNNISNRVCYVMKNKRNGLYKIGYSTNPKDRESTLQSEEPEIQLIKVFKDNHESELHNKYRNQRVRGEWFELSKSQVKYICTAYK